ncbi:fatty acid desaturase [Paraburkholderia silvatlantica]|uniref:Fatty acid desaturase n=1 Tax=Paraburkholderia silvatlantica TaxID=321895 RepID=A0ABR6FHE5_9BURK|nr:fatty acid desaturase [Paraburkholderia silvatlantica]PVY37530.1 fatty acid desaturase [Paraburkholderia silvatlantica]PXW42492.1 fatty acid desaturase [Paraburkholderia silvatlantica]
MNYHVEHHMFPTIPFHALPSLHEVVKMDMPPPYRSSLAAYAEIIPALVRQARAPSYHVARPVPGRAEA